ncbi:hypothetical protein RhiTH_009780, partial [Rhizoctonia solani]
MSASNLTLDKGQKPEPRKLVVCIDGTSNQFSKKNTHVVELYSRIKKDSTQLTYYNSGIGTYARPFMWSFAYQKQQLFNMIDLAVAWNFEKVILGAYRWLVDVYQHGDQIFLFGFSRGAYQVQTLAAMIKKVGLIHPGNQEQIPFAWAIYSNNDENTKEFKEAFCRDKVDLHFVGIWDAVACDYVTHFRHALALDECRVKFLPVYIPIDVQGSRTSKEVWFVGTHSDVGGGNRDNSKLDRGGEPLKWMLEEAYKQGLLVRLHDMKIGMPNGKVTDSMGWIWMILEILPIPWVRFLPGDKSVLSRLPHIMRPREVLPHQLVHWTVKASIERAKDTAGSKSYCCKAKVFCKNNSELVPLELDSPVHWTNSEVSEMADILGGEPRETDEWSTQTGWFKKLREYALGDDGVPDLMWAYRGPQFLQRLFESYYNKRMGDTVTTTGDEFKKTGDKDQEVTDPEPIVRAIIGFDDKIPWKSPVQKETYISVSSRTEGEKKIYMNATEMMDRLHNMVIPRLVLLLKEWMEPERGTHVLVHPGFITSQITKLDANPAKQSWLSWILWAVGYESSEYDVESTLVNWSWYWVPEKNRSVRLLIAILKIVSEIAALFWLNELAAKNDKLIVEQASIESIASHVVDIMSRREKTQVVDQRDEIEIARSVFHDGNILLSLLPLLADEKSELIDPALKTAKLIAADIRYHKHAVIVEDIISYMNDQRLGNAASTMLVVLSENPRCYLATDQPQVLEKLFRLLEDKKYAYADRIVQALRNTPADYWTLFYMRSQDEKVKHWNYMITNVRKYLGGTDAQVQAFATLLRNLMNIGLSGGVELQHIQELNRLLRDLTILLNDAPGSEQAKTERLSVITRFALR